MFFAKMQSEAILVVHLKSQMPPTKTQPSLPFVTHLAAAQVGASKEFA
jgi:hypothetical protein